MQSTLTRDEAYDQIAERIDARVGPALNAYDPERIRKLAALNRGLEAELKKAESAEMVAALATTLRPLAQKAATDVAAMTTATRIFDEMTQRDSAIQKAVLKHLSRDMRDLVDMLEPARNALRESKELLDRADAFVAAQDRDADAAGEDWATAVLDFERLATAAQEEAKRWPWQLGFAKAAVEARDPELLARTRKGLPPHKALDEVSRLNRDTPFAEFHRRYKVGELPATLAEEIRRDTARAMPVFAKVRALAVSVAHMRMMIDGLRIEPVDCRKGLAALGLPAAALPKLNAAVNSPEYRRSKALEALARSFKLPYNGAQMVARLKSVGVV